MRYTVILVPGEEAISVSVPAMPGCLSQGRTRQEARASVRDAISGWIASEADQGRSPLVESPAVVAGAVSEALAILEEMREAGEMAPRGGYELELTSVEVAAPVRV